MLNVDDAATIAAWLRPCDHPIWCDRSYEDPATGEVWSCCTTCGTEWNLGKGRPF